MLDQVIASPMLDDPMKKLIWDQAWQWTDAHLDGAWSKAFQKLSSVSEFSQIELEQSNYKKITQEFLEKYKKEQTVSEQVEFLTSLSRPVPQAPAPAEYKYESLFDLSPVTRFVSAISKEPILIHKENVCE